MINQFDFLKNHARENFINYLVENNLPCHVGEYGCMAKSVDPVVYALLHDMGKIWNEYGLSFCLWQFRGGANLGPDELDMGLLIADIDQYPAESKELRESVYKAWKESLQNDY